MYWETFGAINQKVKVMIKVIVWLVVNMLGLLFAKAPL